MNVLKDSAGHVTGEHILSKGFKVFKTIEGNDMGQMSWSIPQYENTKCKIEGGYWHHTVSNHKGQKLWEGWWNSNEEFDQVMEELDLL